MVFSDDSPPPVPSTTPYPYTSLPLWQLRPGLIFSCTYSSPVLHPSTRIPNLSCRASYQNGLASVRCTWFLALVILFPLLFLLFSALFCCTECGGHGTVRYSFFFLSLLPLLHISRVSGATITSYLLYPTPSSTLTAHCSPYPIYLALWVAWHHGWASSGESASGRKGSHLRIANRTFT